ncbi:ABC transporter ATP-binding protein [Spiroplasma clarkii]|uniref:ABC transporter ATP-binding protein n=1 Tax=Spiroplasma clarkii TaxID=2139 RepID=A0A2K8KJ85_9MOLU|nr:ABC transporter ATP-binding protein [Spiroplasma clarkii]ATX71352.1 ABC transporter ATP-binding protein [Spiroplasma clarkii]
MIEVINLSKTYKNSTFGITKINFTIKPSDVVAFVGNNGAGKTTTIKAIFNELKISEGEVLFDGESIFENENLKKVAFFPDSNNIGLSVKAKDYIFYHGYVMCMKKNDIQERLNQIAKSLNIENLLNNKIINLSAGQKKQIILASVLIQKPQYIFFDEPTANLDVESKIEFMKTIEEIHQAGIGILIASHVLEELQQVANKLVLIDQGKIVFSQEIDKSKDDILQIYLKHHTKKEGNIKLEDVLRPR